MKNKKIKIVIATLLVGLIASVYCGRRHYKKHKPEKMANYIAEKVSDELELDDAQKQKLNVIKDAVVAKHKSFKFNKGEFFDEFINQAKADSVDQAKLNKLFEQKEADFKEIRKFAIAKYSDFLAILTAEQKAKLVEEMQDRRTSYKRWH